MPDVRVLSVKQPWASLIVRGVKRFEARTWAPKWRGRIAIHASGSPIRKSAWLELCASAEVAQVLAATGLRTYTDVQNLPRSAIVGAVNVVDARIVADWSADELSELDVGLASGWPADIVWRLTDAVEFTPIADVLGKLNLWTLTGAEAALITQRDRPEMAWDGAPADDAAVEDAQAAAQQALASSKDWLEETVTVPPELRAVLRTPSRVTARAAFYPLFAEVLDGAPFTWETPWEDPVSVDGPIGRVLFAAGGRVPLLDVCHALAARLTPDAAVPGYLMPFLSASWSEVE